MFLGILPLPSDFMVMTDSDLEVMCLDCEEQWRPLNEPVHCICEEPADDAWLLFIKDNKGKWIKTTLDAIDSRHFKERI